MYKGVISEEDTELIKISLPNGMQKTGRFKCLCWRIDNTNTATELNLALSKGAEVTLVSGDYVYTRIFVPSELEIAGS